MGSFKKYARSKLPVSETPSPPRSFLFVLYVPPPPLHPSTYVRFSESPPPSPQKKFRGAYDAYFE